MDDFKFAQEMAAFRNSEKGRLWIEQQAKEYAKQLSIKNEKIKEIFSNYDYVNWLCEFTLEHERFYDNDWEYFPERISEYDYEKVRDLKTFFEGIEKYANEMNIDFIELEDVWGYFYNVRFNDIGFRLGVMQGQGTCYSCQKVTIENENAFIDIGDIIRFGNINPKLRNLSQVINLAYHNGCTREEIMDVVNDTIERLSLEEGKHLTMDRQG